MNFPRLWHVALFVIFAVLCAGFGLWLRAIYQPEWMLADTTLKPPAIHPWTVEGDCYSQLARCQRILNGQGLIQNHFTVENWPEGLTPSTTSTFDYAILLLYFPLKLFVAHPLDWAGALVSPLLWFALVAFWTFIRSREFTLAGRALLIIGSAIMPPLIWATAFGRPRHQSLILFLMALALTAEYERWQIELTPKRAWNIFAGIIWGLACWTSLFEPLLAVVFVIVFNLAVRRRENPAFLLSFGIVMLIALLVEGVHIFVPPPEYHDYLTRWFFSIAETQGMGFDDLMNRLTLILLALPVIAFFVWRRGKTADYLVILLTALLIFLTLVQRRWNYYASLGELIIIVRFFQLAPLHWSRLIVLFILFVGVSKADYDSISADQKFANQPSQQLYLVSKSIDQPGGIMAPWWLSPGLLYFSGQPIVTGSSHCGISGIVDGAKFYCATSWAEALDILKKRKVRWIVVWDDPNYSYPLLDSSRSVLDIPPATDDDKGDADSTIAQLLINDHLLPTSIQLRNVTQHIKLYEYVPDAR